MCVAAAGRVGYCPAGRIELIADVKSFTKHARSLQLAALSKFSRALKPYGAGPAGSCNGERNLPRAALLFLEPLVEARKHSCNDVIAEK